MATASGAGGVQPLQVQIRITTTGAKAAATAMGAVTRASGGMSRSLGTGVITARTLGDAMRMSASLMKYTVAGAFMKVGQAALQAFRNFELSFARIRGLVGVSADAVEEMKKGVLEMASETTRGPEELAEALYFITSAGLRDASTAMSVLESSAKASAAGMGETRVVADAVTSAMNAYGPTMLSASRATDILVAAVREGKAEADTFAPAFSKVLPVSAAFGASFNDVAAAMAALTRSGMTAGTAGIYVRQTLSQLLKPSKQAQEALAAVGTSADEVRQNIRDKGLFAGLSELSTKLGGTDEGAEKFAKVFGNVRALTAMLQLVGPAAAENEEIFRRMSNTTGDLDHAFKSYSETIDAKYNQAFADSRVALIQMGEALKPVATLLLETASIIAKGFTALFKILGSPAMKAITAVVAGFVLLVVGGAAVMKTTSALIRLFANMTMTLFGTQIMYDANAKGLYRLSIAQATANKQTAHGILLGKGYTKVNIGLLATFKALKAGIIKAALAMKTFVMGHPIMMAFAAAIIAASAAFMFFKSRAEAAYKVSAENMIKQLGKVNELLDQTVAYGTIGIGFNIEADTTEQVALEKDMERIRTQIEEQAPELMGALKELGKKSKVAQAAAVKGMMQGMFANLGPEPKKALLAVFQKDLFITDQEYKDAIVGDITGDAVTDAIIQVASSAAINAGDYVRDAVTNTNKLTLEGLVQVYKDAQKLVNLQKPGDFTFASPSINKSLEIMGQGFVDFIQTSGDLTPVIMTLKELDEAGINSASTYQKVLGTALTGLTGKYDLVGDSAGNLFDLFSRSENIESGVLRDLVQQTAKIGDIGLAADAVTKIKTELDKIPKANRTASAGFQVFMNVLDEYMIVQGDMTGLSEDLQAAFEAERDIIKQQIDDYKTASDAIKAYADAQRALRGVAQDQEEALRGFYDAIQDTGDAIRESGGNLSIGTEGGRKARAELQASAEALFEYANAVAVNDPQKAGQIVKAGLQNIVAVAEQAGGFQAGKGAIDFLEKLGFTAQNFRDSVIASQEGADKAAYDTGMAVSTGIAQGISGGTQIMSDALVAALNNTIVTAKNKIESDSPSKLTERVLGIPMMQGVGVGLAKEAKSGRMKGAVAKSLDTVVSNMFKSSNRAGISKYLSNFLEKKKNVETPAQDFVKATIGRMKDIIGSLGNYIKSQLSFRDAQANLAKLINMQRKYDDDRKKSAREVQYAETRRGRMGGAEVTGYEQAELDQLQLEFERVSRDYAMGRAQYTELVDAEIALFEARAAASEINDEVINSQNDFIDKTVQVENKNLELASATVGVLEAYQDVQEAAAELYMNHKELAGVYDSLAKATGIASGKIVIGSKDVSKLGDDVNALGGYSSTVGGYVSTLGNNIGITGQAFNSNFYGENGIFKTLTKTGTNADIMTKGIGASFENLARGLLNKDSQMYKDLESLGPAIFNSIQLGAQEALDKSALNLVIDVNAVVSKNGNGSFAWKITPLDEDREVTDDSFDRVERERFERIRNKGKAVGGPVVGSTPYMVGERGPEMFVPKVSGTIVTNSALERYTRTRPMRESDDKAGAANNIVVTVNNPVPEAAQDSITRRMKVLANSGLFG